MKIQVFITNEDIGETKDSFEDEMKQIAEFIKDVNIEVSPETVKTDITKLIPFGWLTKEDIGSFMRSKIRWYLQEGY